MKISFLTPVCYDSLLNFPHNIFAEVVQTIPGHCTTSVANPNRSLSGFSLHFIATVAIYCRPWLEDDHLSTSRISLKWASQYYRLQHTTYTVLALARARANAARLYKNENLFFEVNSHGIVPGIRIDSILSLEVRAARARAADSCAVRMQFH